jgi:hypothetical protein
MATKRIIPIEEFCNHYEIEVTFIHSLHEHGLAEISLEEKTPYIREDKIKDVERMIRMHYDLDINMEGIEAISHLLDRLEQMQTEIKTLKNRLNFYESH